MSAEVGMKRGRDDDDDVPEPSAKRKQREYSEEEVMELVNSLVEDASAKPVAQASSPRKKKYYKKKSYRKKYYRNSRYGQYTRPMVYPTLLPPMPLMPYPPNISSAIPSPIPPIPMTNPTVCHPAHPYYAGATPNPWGYR